MDEADGQTAARRAVRLARLDVRGHAVRFRFPFRHHLAERRGNRGLIVSVATADGAVGFGEILPRPYLTGETPETARDALARWWPRLEGRVLELGAPGAPADDALAPLRDALAPLYAEADDTRQTAAYAGLDVAVVDACLRATGRSAARLFSDVPPPPARLTGALGLAGPAKTAFFAFALARAGFRDFKIKLGRPDDARRLAAARRALGPAAPLRADANGAWSPDDPPAAWASRRELLARHGVGSVEQPVPADVPEAAFALAAAAEALDVPVMADESLVTRADAEALLAAFPRTERLRWNLRAGKVGGFSGMRALCGRGKAAGVGLHLGVLVGETSVLGAAGRACLGLGPFEHVEYGFTPLLLRDDPFGPPPPGLRGVGPPPGPAPGLGVRPRAGSDAFAGNAPDSPDAGTPGLGAGKGMS